jgi:hypothetical protein
VPSVAVLRGCRCVNDKQCAPRIGMARDSKINPQVNEMHHACHAGGFLYAYVAPIL